MGRPTKYKKIFAKKMVDYFKKPPYIEKKVRNTTKSGVFSEQFIRIPNDLPTFFGFAQDIGVCRDTLSEWAKHTNIQKYPEFSVAYMRAKELQKNFLITNGLLGLYPAKFAIFACCTLTDMRKNPPKQAVDMEKPFEISIIS